MGALLTLIGHFYSLHEGIVTSKPKYMYTAPLLAGMYLGYISIFQYLSNLPVDVPIFVGVQKRFWLQSHLIGFLWLAVGLRQLLKWVAKVMFGLEESQALTANTNENGNSNTMASENRTTPGSAAAQSANRTRNTESTGFGLLVLFVSVVWVGSQVYTHYDTQDMSQRYDVDHYARAILEPLPQNSMLMVRGDLFTFTSRYLQICEGVRPDVTIIDLALMSYAWSVPRLRVQNPHVTFPADYYVVDANKEHELPPGFFCLNDFVSANHQRFRMFLSHTTLGHHEPPSDFVVWYRGHITELYSTAVILNQTVIDDVLNGGYEVFGRLPVVDLGRTHPEAWEDHVARVIKRQLLDALGFIDNIADNLLPTYPPAERYRARLLSVLAKYDYTRGPDAVRSLSRYLELSQGSEPESTNWALRNATLTDIMMQLTDGFQTGSAPVIMGNY
eukprot:TRINITY_DN7884_c0_g1::TRINITY_DN7884_c0_g1_i1::g.23764::m.23764 TRINITY_DN7884_c0_g1::TRINITY_DN7884_c0_g1_i1::g.23764  ORF type:complete len:445 (-),score=101.86,sp/Q9NX78/TM260_HUMAN/24.50/2e-26 TRINITY_DN7884_c0_g1_i1:70-1404(-)